MSRKIDWKSKQDPDYRDKLRLVGKRLPKDAYEGLQNLDRLVTSTPIRGNSPTGARRPLTDDEYRQQISDTKRSVENFLDTNVTESSNLTPLDTSAILHDGFNTNDSEGLVDVFSETFWSVSDSITNMADIKDFEHAKEQIAILTENLRKHKEQISELQLQHKDE